MLIYRTSLVVQWIRIRLPGASWWLRSVKESTVKAGTQSQLLVWEDSTCLKPVGHILLSPDAAAAAALTSRARAPQQGEAAAMRNSAPSLESSPALSTTSESLLGQQRLSTATNKQSSVHTCPKK